MGCVADILREKPDQALHTIHPRASVLTATQQMNAAGIGAILVMDDDEMLVGIFTERDVLRRVIAAELLPASIPVGDVMTNEVACCAPETSVDDARSIFRQYRVRHLPVIDRDGNVVGLISIGDLNAHLSNHQEVTIHYLHEYMLGRV
ncbi:MAG TPA: CBS domain-containing protein [Planctomycetaceae bacterium]|nr:CBS domain-containing protein [Planctomycetaceae bacterium]